MNIQDLIRPNIKKLKPYSSARKEYSGQANVLLDANENPFENGMNRYPDPVQISLKNEIAKQKNIQAKNILLGNGSDEIIDLLIRVFCEPKEDEIMVLPPTFGMYEVAANISNIGIKKINLTPDYQPNTKQILDNSETKTKLLFLCTPNNPTGNSFPVETLKFLIEKFNGIVVIDEAYIDFSEQESAINWLENYPNLVVIQTFSKAWGLAGIRLGAAFASAEIIEVLNRIKMPYNVNVLTQEIALKAVQNPNEKDKQVTEILSQKKFLKRELERLNFIEKIYPSDANFFLVKVRNSSNLIQYLRKKGIIIRDRSKMILCKNCVRITIGKKEENIQLMDALKLFQDTKNDKK